MWNFSLKFQYLKSGTNQDKLCDFDDSWVQIVSNLPTSQLNVTTELISVAKI